VRKKFHDLLHAYKVEAFKVSHTNECVNERTQEILQFTEEALNNAYHFHFDKNPDPARLEALTEIKNFTLEAIMPPILEKIVQRLVVHERQHDAMVKLVDGILEVLSDDRAKAREASAS